MIPHSCPWVLPEDKKAVLAALDEKRVCTWHKAKLLVDRIAVSAGAGECELYATGTLALCAALRDLNLPQGSGVGMPSFTCSDVLRGILAAGLNPVILDCDEQGLVSFAAVAHSYKQGKIKAMVCVHQFGLLCRKRPGFEGLPVVEDCSHVPPGFYYSDSVSAFGSMEGTKLIGVGEGGYYLRRKKADSRNFAISLNIGDRLSDVLAVLALNQLDRLKENLERRAELARHYIACCHRGRILDGERAAFFRFLLELESKNNADQLIVDAEAAGISVKRPIMPAPVHRLWSGVAYKCPNADILWERVVSVPLYPALSKEEEGHVARFLERTCS